jgi:hypothetical protein
MPLKILVGFFVSIRIRGAEARGNEELGVLVVSSTRKHRVEKQLRLELT